MSGVPRVLSIAGTDPTGGAGIQADLKSIAANGGYGMAVVTALVAQNTQGVRSVHVPPTQFLAEQLDAVSDDVVIDSVKIGMLANTEVIATVKAWLDRVRPPVIVLDPVMVATSGDRLLDRDAEQALRDLASRVDLVTPNIPELAILAEEPTACDWNAVIGQAKRVAARLGVRVLAKGGHLGGEELPDALIDARGHVIEFPGERIETTNTHGTGCSLSSAIATRYAATGDWASATGESKRWLGESIRHGSSLEVGSGNGPVSHFAGLWERGGIVTRPTPGEVITDWWEYIRDLRESIDDVPFVRALGDGTLDQDAFVWYLKQDALYLRDYSRALAEASRLAPTGDEQAFWAASAHGAVATEMQLHESWIPADALGETYPSAVTSGYLNHLLATSARGDYAVLIAALLPCFWLYQDVGTRLHPHSHAEHRYRTWLDTYADDAFAAATERAMMIVAGAAAHADETTRARMREAFRASAAHELAFFAAPYEIWV
ncbi:hydroxymethylpyrimidine kinase/phosphomethylpyrimidine kinase [Microbacterium endophyticum]|uniref:Hydroxymethylpyrimidine kinase/phosphomethylpyrimidine kinase n=1 Tax=Microbacterium endophyticum TaxID=1526412 RepID=A0A7W4YNX3_9MICO|nr:bifunctional hydroxymethylpyrimidine kinase/phosphomethylpyrimidine kinase [Microbacterium endophyticum]MBB2976151.1 hydroxymethylpyrimidine kinase/phosphomethylpyrimidine kinase [Microbacterium endophyticum]NIK36448.1 hydroxymethylpyrimidine kinase/phosphomethylpyrimidine kinase [Microbacterium endophyticum]